jgi:hypothetical protein
MKNLLLLMMTILLVNVSVQAESLDDGHGEMAVPKKCIYADNSDIGDIKDLNAGIASKPVSANGKIDN